MSTRSDELPVALSGRGLAAMQGDRSMPLRGRVAGIVSHRHFGNLAGTIATTFVTYAIFLIQGVIVARILGPEGRGEFGTCLYFPRDILLYAGLLGGVEIITAHSVRRLDARRLRGAAARLGFLTGCLTAIVAGTLAIILLMATSRAYLIPYALFCCLFLPLEHMQLTMSAVDRGAGDYLKYNLNRLFFALSFPVLAGLAWLADLQGLTGINWLALLCAIWLVSRMTGLIPTLFPGRRPADPADDPQFGRENLVPAVGNLLRDGRPYAVSMLVSEVFERLDIFLVLALFTLTDAGNYFVALPAAATLTIVPNALGIFTFNYGARSRQPVARGLAFRAMLGMVAIQLVAVMLLSFVISDLILFCFSDRFAPAISIVRWLLPAFAIKGFLQAADAYLKGRGKPMAGVRARLVSILLMLLAVAIFHRSMGLPSIPLAAALGQVFSMVVICGAILLESRPGHHAGEEQQ